MEAAICKSVANGGCNLQGCCPRARPKEAAALVFLYSGQPPRSSLPSWPFCWCVEIINRSDSAQINHDVSYVPMKQAGGGKTLRTLISVEHGTRKSKEDPFLFTQVFCSTPSPFPLAKIGRTQREEWLRETEWRQPLFAVSAERGVEGWRGGGGRGAKPTTAKKHGLLYYSFFVQL